MFTDEAMKKLSAQKNQYREGVLPPRGQHVFPFHHLQTPHIEAGNATSHGHKNQDSKEGKPKLSVWGAILLLAAATVMTGVTAEFLVSVSRFGLRVRV